MSELDDLYRALRETGYCVNLADTNATILFSRLPGEAAKISCDWKIYTGSISPRPSRAPTGWAPRSPKQSPVLVHRDEHFREQWQCSPARWRRCSTMPGGLPAR